LGFGAVGLIFAVAGLLRWWGRVQDRSRKSAVLGMAAASSVQIVFHSPQAAMGGAALLASWDKNASPRAGLPAAGLALGLALSLFGAAAFQAVEYHHAEGFQASGDLPEAYRALRRAERLDAWDSRSYAVTRSFEEEMYLRTGDPTWRARSDASFERMTSLEPLDGKLAFLRAQRDSARALKTGDRADLKKAMGAWKDAREACPRSASVRYEEGVFNIRLGSRDRAATAFADAVALEPAFARAWLNLGNVLKERGQRDAARAAYRQALRAGKAWVNAPLAPIERDLVDLPPEARRHAEKETAP